MKPSTSAVMTFIFLLLVMVVGWEEPLDYRLGEDGFRVDGADLGKQMIIRADRHQWLLLL